MNKLTKFFIRFSLGFYILCVCLSICGIITFGHGLGDLFYIVFLIIWTIIIFGFYRFTKKINFNSNRIEAIFINVFLISTVYFTTRQYTIDRGSEFKWDGNIFLFSAKMEHQRNLEKNYLRKINYFDSLIKLNPNNYEVYYEKGLLYRHSGQWKKSIEEYEKAILINQKYYDAYFEIAYSYSCLKQYPKAILYYNKAHETDTTEITAKKIAKNLKEYHKLK